MGPSSLYSFWRPEEIWQRSIENVSQALPVAARHGINIVVENVWNRFMYDHGGDSTQTAEAYLRFVDELNSPLVGMQFDVGNHWKYGSMGDWIRQLGRRIFKLDLKGFSRAKDQETGNGWTRIGEGDVDWRDVRLALDEIGFHGWAAAEVGGGDLEHLKGVASRVDSVLGL
ncbi:MAG: sugar phosphate isomerase/epimerase family protein [Planctomycetota bacterium]